MCTPYLLTIFCQVQFAHPSKKAQGSRGHIFISLPYKCIYVCFETRNYLF